MISLCCSNLYILSCRNTWEESFIIRSESSTMQTN